MFQQRFCPIKHSSNMMQNASHLHSEDILCNKELTTIESLRKVVLLHFLGVTKCMIGHSAVYFT